MPIHSGQAQVGQKASGNRISPTRFLLKRGNRKRAKQRTRIVVAPILLRRIQLKGDQTMSGTAWVRPRSPNRQVRLKKAEIE